MGTSTLYFYPSSSPIRIIPRYWKFIQMKVRHSTEAGITFLVDRLVTGWRSGVRAQVGWDIPYSSEQITRYWFSFSSVGGPDAYIRFQLWVGTESWWVDSLRSKPLTRVDFIGAHGAICQDYQNCLVVCWLTLNIRREKGGMW